MRFLLLAFLVSSCCSLSSHQRERLREKCSFICGEEEKEINCKEDCLKCSCGKKVCLKDL